MELQILTILEYEKIDKILQDNKFRRIVGKNEYNFERRITTIISSDVNRFSNTKRIEESTGISIDAFKFYVVFRYFDKTASANNNWNKVASVVDEFEDSFVLINAEDVGYIKKLANSCNEKFKKNYKNSNK